MATKMHEHILVFLMHTQSDDCKMLSNGITTDLIDKNNGKAVNTELKRLQILLRVLSSYEETPAGRMEKLKKLSSFINTITHKQALGYFAVLSAAIHDSSLMNFDFEILEKKVKAGHMSEGMYLRLCNMFKEVHKFKQMIGSD
jgi:hypothetical protein